MKKQNLNKGFSAVEILIVLVVVGLIAAAAYVVYDRQNSDTDGTNTSESATAKDVQQPPAEINDTNDLKEAEAALDANDPALSEQDEAALDEELSNL